MTPPESALGVLDVEPNATRGRAEEDLAPRRALLGPLRHPALAAFAAYALLALIANYPYWPGDGNHLAACLCGGNQDPAQTAWFLAWTPYALLHGHNPFLTDWVNYPIGVNLAQNTSMPLLGLLTAPLTLLASPVASENLLRWLAFPLSAGAMYYVAGRFVRWAPASFAAGLLYGFSPYMVGQASAHLNLSFVPLPPIILYGLYELVAVQRTGVLRRGLLLGALMVAQFLISAEVLATTALAGGVALCLLVVGNLRDVPRRAAHALAGGAVAVAITAACLAYPVWLMVAGPQHYLGPAQGGAQVYNADLFSTIVPTFAQLVAPHHLSAVSSSLLGSPGNVDENGSYLGIPLLVLVVALGLRSTRRRLIGFLALAATCTFVLSLGPRLEFEGRAIALPFRLPFVALAHLPLVQNALPVRLALYVMLFLALGVALGLDDLAWRLSTATGRRERTATGPGRRPRRVGVVAEAGTVAVFSLATIVSLVPRWPYRAVPLDRPPGLPATVLASIRSGGAVLTYPYATPFTDDAMLWQALSGMRIKIFGSYMLRPGLKGAATAWPSELRPLVVQSMLSTGLAPVAIPGLVYFAPTSRTVVASRIVIAAPGRLVPPPTGASVVGVVENVHPGTGAFYVATRGHGLTGVTLTHATLVGGAPGSAGSREVVRGEHVAVYGRTIPGTVTAPRVRDLRTFLRAHAVSAVLVATGRVDAAEVAAWIRAAIGPATRVWSGGALWLSVPRRLALRVPRPTVTRI